MVDKIKPKFTFQSESKDVKENTFHVVNFKGNEGLSTLYHFRILLISSREDLDLVDLLNSSAEFTIQGEQGAVSFKGVLSSFEQMQQAGSMYFYRVELTPQIWRASLTHNNKIYLDKNIKGLITQAFEFAGFKENAHFRFALKDENVYPELEYVCQYNESYFHFVSRWMEQAGLYYYFEQTKDGEKMVITDTSTTHSNHDHSDPLLYLPVSGLNHTKQDECISDFLLKQQPMPNKVILKSYNYRTSSTELKAEAKVSEKGIGEIYVYGDHFLSNKQGKRLAQIRAEEIQCRERLFYATSNIPFTHSGYTFTLAGHYRTSFNQAYLTTDVSHEGSQEAYMVSGLGIELASDRERLYYQNTMTVIPATVQYRAERKTDKPQLVGSITAKIDAAGSGQYAELDEQGRYKVIMPFDESGRHYGKASTWLRKAEPYGGSAHGMHFPLLKGTEVLITCINGDPDQPIIQGVTPNPRNPSLVNDASQTSNKLTTAGGNMLHMEDKKDNEGILMQTPGGKTSFQFGFIGEAEEEPADTSCNSDEEDKEEEGDGSKPKTPFGRHLQKKGFVFKTKGDWEREVVNSKAHIYGNEFKAVFGGVEESIFGNETSTVLGVANTLVGGSEARMILGALSEVILGHDLDIVLGGTLHSSPHDKHVVAEKESISAKITELQASVTRLVESAVSIQQNVSEITQDQQTVVENVARIEGSNKSLVAQVEEINESSQKLSQSMTTVSQEVTNVTEKCMLVADEQVIIANSVSQISEQQTLVSEEVNAISDIVTLL